MIRIVTLAALAAAIALPASAQSIHIPTAGKTPAQVDAAIRKAARSLCADATVNATFRYTEMQACVAQTIEKTYQQAALAAPTKVAQR